MRIIGIDLAWQTEKNPSAVAIGQLHHDRFTIDSLADAVTGHDAIMALIDAQENVAGISIDAPLIINNVSGQRDCERALNDRYRAYKAGCHSSNQTLYPSAGSVLLSRELEQRGYEHLGTPGKQNWQIECYPHPSIVEWFQLKERHPYKKGNVAAKKRGQVMLAEMLRSLRNAYPSLIVADHIEMLLQEERIMRLRGGAIKQNEDAIDALICAYIGACYQTGISHHVFGDSKEGYIYVPTNAVEPD